MIVAVYFIYLTIIAGVIDVLVNTGRQIDAVNLSYAFGLTEKYAPVPLLKSYLKEVRKLFNAKSGSMSPGAQVGFLVCFFNFLVLFFMTCLTVRSSDILFNILISGAFLLCFTHNS